MSYCNTQNSLLKNHHDQRYNALLDFSVILPAVALGVLNSKNTHGDISVYQVMVGQTFGAIIFALMSGQPLVVVMTTAPLALFIKVGFSLKSK